MRLESFDELPASAAAFDKMFGLLKPRGIAATTYMPRNKNPSRDDAVKLAAEVEGIMQASGFANIHIEELPLEPVPALCVVGEHP